ncbi:hypothetical protein AMELA_G00054140 [Ameiurus melas]|uniref:Uncharacterized protein n=1 Tax=Ameiurus melas TaxID=219545 RepID=A0A7J6B6C4_AMEME|nr:hypothetical protein AMELA_G00054140 [Ameiurus melas]
MAKFLFMMFILSTLICESVCAVSETASNLWQSAHSALKSLGDDAHSYLVSLFGQQTVNTLLKTTGDGINEISQAVSHALNAVEVYITEILRAAGIDAKLQKIFTPEGVVLVGQWALLTVPQYWLLLAGEVQEPGKATERDKE